MMQARVLVAVLVCTSQAAWGQRASGRWQMAGRVDALAARITAIQAGVELSARTAEYVRLGLVGGLGGSWSDSTGGLSARLELAGRFMLDPEFTVRWSPYATGGIGVRYDRIAAWRGVLVVGVGIEGPDWNGVVPFLEVGYGGGGRVGVGLRRTRSRGR